MTMDILNEIAWHSFLIFLCIGSGAAVAVGIGMLLMPKKMERINQFMARWIDTDRMETVLDKPRWTERYFYRHHRLTGAFLLAGAVFVLHAFLFAKTKEKISVLFNGDIYGFLDALSAIFIIGSVVAALIGATMLGRPSMLREFEAAANHWISTDRALCFFNNMHFSAERLMMRYRKIVAAFLVLGGLYSLLILGKLLWAGQWHF
jgi:hypothetical protein